MLTPVTKEALPLIRYRTGDISSLEVTPCVCGRTTVRMSRIKGRYDDMLIIRGVNLYPSEVERILLGVGDVAPHYQLVVDRPGALDELSVLCEPAREGLDRGLLQSRLQHALREETGISIAVQVLDATACPGARARRSGSWTGVRGSERARPALPITQSGYEKAPHRRDPDRGAFDCPSPAGNPLIHHELSLVIPR